MLLCHLRNCPVVQQLDKSGRPLVFFFLSNGLTRDLRLSISNSAPFFFLLKQKSKWNKRRSFQHADSKYEIEKRERLQQGWLYPKRRRRGGRARLMHVCVCVYVPRKVYIWRSSSGTEKRISHSQNSLLRAYVEYIFVRKSVEQPKTPPQME
jgi:hypothetical protein